MKKMLWYWNACRKWSPLPQSLQISLRKTMIKWKYLRMPEKEKVIDTWILQKLYKKLKQKANKLVISRSRDCLKDNIFLL